MTQVNNINTLTQDTLVYLVGVNAFGKAHVMPVSAFPRPNVEIIAGSGLTGGGDLTSDVTLAIDPVELLGLITSIVAALPSSPSVTPTLWLNGGVVTYS